MALDDEIRGLAGDFNAPAPSERHAIGTVTAVAANGAQGGTQPLVTVDVNGSTQQMCGNPDVTYANGNKVLVLIRNAVPIIVCRLGNFPPDT